MNTHICNSLDQIKQLNEDLICQNEELKKGKQKEKEQRGGRNQEQERGKNGEKEKEWCKFDKRGTCEKGINCRYKHRERSITEWCRFDKEGRCSKGEDCKFRHSSRYNTDNNKRKEWCRYDQNGQCIKGERCEFKHREEGIREKESETCRFYQRNGFCKYGSNCKYTHKRDQETERNKWAYRREEREKAEGDHARRQVVLEEKLNFLEEKIKEKIMTMMNQKLQENDRYQPTMSQVQQGYQFY